MELLNTLTSAEKTKICDCLRPVRYKEGDNIITEGEKGHVFYFIEEGTAYASKNIGGTAARVFDYKEGDYFGELALLKDEPRAASIVAEVRL